MALPPSSSQPEPKSQLELFWVQVGILQQLLSLKEGQEQSWDIYRPLSWMEIWEVPPKGWKAFPKLFLLFVFVFQFVFPRTVTCITKDALWGDLGEFSSVLSCHW